MMSGAGKYRTLLMAGLAVLAGLPLSAMGQDAPDIKYKGAAWLQFGRIMHSTDSLAHGEEANNMNGNWLQAAGVSVASVARFGPQWDGAMGVVALQSHAARGDLIAIEENA